MALALGSQQSRQYCRVGTTGSAREALRRPPETPSAVCSWSGGKDSALALALAREAGSRPGALLTVFDEIGRTRSHGLPRGVVEAQASALGLPLITRSASWADYTDAFADGLSEAARRLGAGRVECVFGDIAGDEHRSWGAKVCARVGVAPHHPLWQRSRRALINELICRRYVARIVVVRAAVLDASFLSRRVDNRLVSDLLARGVDVSGEGGEYHTVVTDGADYAAPIPFTPNGVVAVGGCLVLRLRAPRTQS